MERVSQAIRKTVRSLATAKGRRESNAFMTERNKNVLELLDGPFGLRHIIATHAWYEERPDIQARYGDVCLKADKADMERMSTLSTPSDVIAVFELPEPPVMPTFDRDSLYIALDGIQDPGNMGTILRLADWFGVDTVLAGKGTVDAFNPKTVIASMGSIARLQVVECDLPSALDSAARRGINIWGTFLDGENIYTALDTVSPAGIIVLGNEGNGIAPQTEAAVTRRISIPSYASGRHAESLNVAMAASITLAEFRRRSTVSIENDKAINLKKGK